MITDDERILLIRIFSESKKLGFLGPGPVESHIDHSLKFAGEIDKPPSRVLDLGSGGGIPGLVLVLLWPSSSFTLLDSMMKRCVFLRHAVIEMGMQSRVEVCEGRAEHIARKPGYRSSFDLVTSRSFGSPAVTAECAAGFLELDGRLIVSEPPDERSRWNEQALMQLGMRPEKNWATPGTISLIQAELCPLKYPRRVGIPNKRPLF